MTNLNLSGFLRDHKLQTLNKTTKTTKCSAHTYLVPKIKIFGTNCNVIHQFRL